MDSEKHTTFVRACLYFLILLLLNESIKGRELGKEASLMYHLQAAMKVGNNSAINTNEAAEYNIHMAKLRSHSNGKFLGAKATFSVHGLSTFSGEKRGMASVMSIVISSGDYTTNNYETIHAGWHFFPDLYGDLESHFFIYAARKGRLGCFNLEPCSGFVLNKGARMVPGYKLWPYSRPHGQQVYLNIRIEKDKKHGNWWLFSGPAYQEPVGYFPYYFFSSLRDHAESVLVGGEVAYRRGNTGPPMGSGYYAEAGDGVAAGMFYVAVELVHGHYFVDNNTFDSYADNPKCYSIDGHVVNQRSIVYIGGPEGCRD